MCLRCMILKADIVTIVELYVHFCLGFRRRFNDPFVPRIGVRRLPFLCRFRRISQDSLHPSPVLWMLDELAMCMTLRGCLGFVRTSSPVELQFTDGRSCSSHRRRLCTTQRPSSSLQRRPSWRLLYMGVFKSSRT